jgi:hypothetical protein
MAFIEVDQAWLEGSVGQPLDSAPNGVDLLSKK